MDSIGIHRIKSSQTMDKLKVLEQDFPHEMATTHGVSLETRHDVNCWLNSPKHRTQKMCPKIRAKDHTDEIYQLSIDPFQFHCIPMKYHRWYCPAMPGSGPELGTPFHQSLGLNFWPMKQSLKLSRWEKHTDWNYHPTLHFIKNRNPEIT